MSYADGLQPDLGGRKLGGEPVPRADRLEESLGGKGCFIITDTAAKTPAANYCFVAVQALTDTVIAAATADSNAPITGTIAGLSLPAGTVFYGKLTSLTLTSGTVVAYIGVL